MQTQTTDHLFYGKWPFKIECKINGAGHIAKAGTDRVLAWATSNGSLPRRYSLHYSKKEEIQKFVSVIMKYQNHDIKTRAEKNTYSIFCKDRTLLNDIKHDLKTWVSSVTEPENEEQYNFLTNADNKKILCDAYPWKEYQYKIILRDLIPLESRTSFLNWVEKTKSKVLIGKSTMRWFKGEVRWCYEPFLYVKDAQTLTMVMLYIGTHHRRVYEYILKSSINT